MMKFTLIWSWVLLFCLISASVWSQDQLLLRLNQSGLIHIMHQALKYNRQGQVRPGFKVPSGIYDFKVKKADLDSNPMVQLLREVSDVDLADDLPFFVTNSPVDVTGEMDETQLRTAITNYGPEGFDLRVMLSVKTLDVRTDEIAICEDREEDRELCGDGLKARFKDVHISLNPGASISITADFKVKIQGNVARVKLKRARSNLNQANGPALNISIADVVVPQMTIIINGEEAPMDTSGIKRSLEENKEFLAQKLVVFTGEFIARDLADMVNKALENQCLPTSLRLLEMGLEDGAQVVDGLKDVEAASFMNLLQKDLVGIIKSARLDLKLKSMRTPLDQDVELRADGAFSMNGQPWQVADTLSQGVRPLPPLDIDSRINEQDHLAVVVSEPVINAALDLLQKTGVFQEILAKKVGISGLSLDSLKIFFRSGSQKLEDRFYVVANLRVDLRNTPTTGYWSRFCRWFASWLENDNNNSSLRFPLQLEIIPRMVELPDKSVKLMMQVNSPFTPETTLRNDFRQPNDITEANRMVRRHILEKIKVGLGPFINKAFEFPLESYLKLKGVKIKPTSLQMIDSAYLMVSGQMAEFDLSEINLKSAGGCQ